MTTASAAGRRRWSSLVARALLGVLAVALLGATPAHARQTDDPATGPPPAPPTIELLDRSPWVAADGTLSLEVAVGGGLADSTVRVLVYEALDDVADLAPSLETGVGSLVHVSDPVPTESLPTVGDGRRVDVAGADLGEPGVHPVVVEIRTATAEVTGTVRTPVIVLGTDEEPLPAPRLSLVVDVGVDPTLSPEGRRELTEAELSRLERLGRVLDPDADAVEDGAPVGSTLVVVPDTVEALMASDDARALALLDALTDARAEHTALAAPYVRISARSLTDAGLGSSIEDEVAAGIAVLGDGLDVPLDASVWPDADVDTDSALLLAANGVTSVLADAPTGPILDPDARLLEPAGPREITGLDDAGLRAVTVDTATAEALADPASTRVDAAPLALAELLLRDAGRSSDVAVRIDDVPDDSTLLALLPLLAEPEAPIEVGPLEVGDRTAFLPPAELDGSEDVDLAPIADEHRAATEAVETYVGFVGEDSARTAELGALLLTSLARNLDADARADLIDEVASTVSASFGAVAITGQTDLNLTSRQGDLPVAIDNVNDFPVNVMVRIRSDRLRFPDGGEFVVEAEAGVTRLDVPVEALATGSVPTFVELWTPDGSELLDSRQLNVRSTAVSGVGLTLSLGALAVLAIWWIRTWRRDKRGRGAPAEADKES